MLNLPSSTEFGRRVPKQKFYEHLDVSPEVKRLFIDQIKLITWANKLSPQTMNLGAGQTVTEIEVFHIRLSRTSCSLHPVFQHFSRKYHHLPTNILGRTFRPPWAFCILESFKKTVAPAGYKNKQCRKQTSVLSGRIMTAYVPLRSATERERAAFLIPCQGLRGFDSISLLTLNLHKKV